jgi:hypothetical protein
MKGLTVFDRDTLQVFGCGLTEEEAYQCVLKNCAVIDREWEAKLLRDDPGSDLRLLRIRPLVRITDDPFDDYAADHQPPTEN